MSMTSKVNATLRQEIIDHLNRMGYGITNRGLYGTLGFRYSLRTIQEATQKLTKEETLIAKTGYEGKTFYSLNTSKPYSVSPSTREPFAATV